MEGSKKAALAYRFLTLIIFLGVPLGLAASVGQLVSAAGEDGELKVSAEMQPENASIDLPEGLEVIEPVRVLVNIAHPNARQMGLLLARDLMAIGMFLAGLLTVRAMVRSVRDGEPFGTGNVRRLRRLGFLFLAYPVVAVLASVALGGVLAGTPHEDLLSTGMRIETAPIAAALGVFILAEVFSQGLRLREDVEGTV